MDILITTVGILAIYAFFISFATVDEAGVLVSILCITAFSYYLWLHYDFAVALVIR